MLNYLIDIIKMNKKTSPENLLECLKFLDELLKNSPDIDWFMTASESEVLIESHHGLGSWIRDNWGLKENGKLFKYFNKLGLRHPDDMSSIIMVSYHRQRLGETIRLDEQVKESIDFWKKNDKKNK